MGVTGTPVLPGEPSPISDAQLPALVDQLRPILAAIAKAASADAVLSTPVPRVLAGTVTNVDIAALTVAVLMDDSTEGGEIGCSIVGERPNPNERVMVLWTPGGAAYVLGHVGGGGVPAGTLSSYTGIITAAVSSSTATAPPRGYVWAYGQNLERRDVPWYFAACGTQNDNGSTGATQVGIIDMRGRLPIGLDNMGGTDAGISSLANTIGTTGGAETHTLAGGNLPSHTHTFTPSGTVAVTNPAHTHNNGWGTTYVIAGGGVDYPAAGSDTASTTGSTTTAITAVFTGTGASTGNGPGTGTAVNHLPPVRVVHWLVRV